MPSPFLLARFFLMSLHKLAQDALAAMPEVMIERGFEYWKKGHVLSLTSQLTVHGLRLGAEVAGSAAKPYRVSLLFADGALRVSSCSCPMRGGCKHEAAVLHAVNALGDEDSAALWRQMKTYRAEMDAHEAGRWLQELAAMPKAPAPADNEHLVYVLGILGMDDVLCTVSLRIFRRKRLKNGEPRDALWKGIDQMSLDFPPPFVREPDMPVLQALQALRRGAWGLSGEQTPLSGRAGYAVLEAAVASERCHLADADSPALELAALRPCQLEWTRQDETLQLRLAGVQGPVLPTQPLLLLDERAHQLVPLHTPQSPALVRQLLTQPRLPEAAWRAQWPALRQLCLQADLPLPPLAQMPQELQVTPEPYLHFTVWQRGRRGKQAKGVPVARLRAGYLGARCLPRQGQPQLLLEHEGKSALIMRDLAAEQRWLETLRPLQALDYFFGWQAPEGEARHDLTLRDEVDWPRFLQNRLPALLNAGWHISYDPNFPWQMTDASAADWYGELQADEAGNDWFGLELGVELEGRRVSLVPALAKALRQMTSEERQHLLTDAADSPPLHLMQEDRLLRLPVSRLQPLLRVLVDMLERVPIGEGQPLRLGRMEAARLSAQTDVAWKGAKALQELGARLEGFTGLATVKAPSSFKAELRPYQQTGLDWLQFLRENQLGGVLADDMGLGKTVQTLAHLCVEKKAGRLQTPALIVCPKSVLPNWRREAARFAPGLRVLTIEGLRREALLAQMSAHDVVITTYPLLARDLAVLQEQPFAACICDEAQQLKNHKTKTAQAVRALKVGQRLALTGTPMENHLGELWSLFDWLQPGLLGREDDFRRHYRTPVEKQGDVATAQRLARRVKPFLLRRTKTEVATELPPKTEIVQTVQLAGRQRDLYETVRATMDSKLREVIAEKGFARASIEMLDALLKLRQVCCDPRLLGEDGAESAKLELLLEMLPELLEDGRRVLLFSQFTSMLALIEAALQKAGIAFVKLTGQTRDRDTPVQRFQAGEVPLFLISLKAGGSGLNLTAADTVIHFDPWWNPAVEAQATDRAYRIGQDKPVFVYKLICEGTVEERMQALQARKSALAEGVYGEGAGLDGSLNAEDLQVLLQPLAP